MTKHWTEGGLTSEQIAHVEAHYKVPVDDLFGPMRDTWVLALAKESLLPSEHDLRTMRDAIEWQVEHSFKPFYAAQILALHLASYVHCNTMTFYFDEDGWHGRRSTWTEGQPYWPARYPELGQKPGGTIVEVLEHMLVGVERYQGDLNPEWIAHKATRADLYDPQS